MVFGRQQYGGIQEQYFAILCGRHVYQHGNVAESVCFGKSVVGGQAVQDDAVSPQIDILYVYFAEDHDPEFLGVISRVKQNAIFFKFCRSDPAAQLHIPIFLFGNIPKHDMLNRKHKKTPISWFKQRTF